MGLGPGPTALSPDTHTILALGPGRFTTFSHSQSLAENERMAILCDLQFRMSNKQDLANRYIIQAFENTSTNIAAAQMRNALTSLSETVKDPDEKKVSRQNIPEGNVIL